MKGRSIPRLDNLFQEYKAQLNHNVVFYRAVTSLFLETSRSYNALILHSSEPPFTSPRFKRIICFGTIPFLLSIMFNSPFYLFLALRGQIYIINFSWFVLHV